LKEKKKKEKTKEKRGKKFDFNVFVSKYQKRVRKRPAEKGEEE
jgi:hypothetical protein